MLIFTHISSKGKDRDHSFGHGKFETLATLIVSVILIVVGANLMSRGIQDIIGDVKMAMPSLAELLETSLPEDIEEEIKETAISVKGVNDIHVEPAED